MELKEIIDLISVRQYIANTINNPSIDRNTVNMMSGMLLLIDKKIINLLNSPQFKEYIDFSDVKKAIEDTVKLNTIKSGFKK